MKSMRTISVAFLVIFVPVFFMMPVSVHAGNKTDKPTVEQKAEKIQAKADKQETQRVKADVVVAKQEAKAEAKVQNKTILETIPASALEAGVITAFNKLPSLPSLPSLPFFNSYNQKVSPSNRIIVSYENAKASVLPVSGAVAGIASKYGLREVDSIPELGIKVLSVPSGVSSHDAIQALLETDGVEYAEEDSVSVLADFTPNDPFYPSQWAMPMMGVPSAWDTTKGAGVTIAILDTGADCAQKDLIQRCVKGYNAVLKNSDTADDFGHGTLVAGVAVAEGNNENEIAGIAFGSRLMPIKINEPGTGTLSGSAIIKGAVWAVKHGAKVLNESFGPTLGMPIGSTENKIACYVRSKGAIIFKAAGNDNLQLQYPSPVVINFVGATNEQDGKASFSNYGGPTVLFAPGSGIATLTNGSDQISGGSGTSLASPFVAGLAALMISANPSLKPWQIEQIMYATAHDLGDSGKDSVYGWGRIDAATAVANAHMAVADIPRPPQPPIAYGGVTAKKYIIVKWSPTCDDRGVTVASYEIYRDGTLIGTSTTPSFKDTTRPKGAHMLVYTFKSVSVAGLESEMSAGFTIGVQ